MSTILVNLALSSRLVLFRASPSVLSIAHVHTVLNGSINTANSSQQGRPVINRAWAVCKYDPDVKQAVQLRESSKLPQITRPNDLLIQVHASSINPLDIAMTHGYGNILLTVSNRFMSAGIDRLTGDRLPLTLGRDFVGQIVARGQSVTNYKPGDVVWGTVAPFENGAHADYVVTGDNSICLKPRNLSYTEAASLPYVGLTAWAAVNTFGEIDHISAKGKRVLIFGGAGSVGSFAIQLLKYWGATVVTTCSPQSMESLRSIIDVDEMIDYNETEEYLQQYPGTFDLILDCSSTGAARKNYEILTRIYDREYRSGHSMKHNRVFDKRMTRYVTLSSPLLNNFDRYGLFAGLTSTISDAIQDTLSGLQHGLAFRWAYYLPNQKALEYITNLVERQAIKPYNATVFNFDKALDAYSAIENKTVHGKIVLDFNSNKLKQ